MNLIIEPHTLKSEMSKLGFSNFRIDGEGCLLENTHIPKPEPFFKKKYKGLDCIYEILAQKE